VSDELDPPKKGFAAKIPDILLGLGGLGLWFVCYMVYTNKIPKNYWKFYSYFYMILAVGFLGFLGESAATTFLAFVIPIIVGGGTLAMLYKPEKYAIEDWWNIYSILVLFSAGFIVYLFLRYEQLKKMKSIEGEGSGPHKMRIDPAAAAKYREQQANKEAAADIKIDGLKEEDGGRKLKKRQEKAAEPIDPNETPEQRMEREIRQIKDEFSKKSMKVSTMLLRMKNLAKSLDKDEIFQSVMEVIGRGLEAERIQLLINNEKEGKLQIVKAEGMSAKDIRDIIIPLEENSMITFLVKRRSGKNTGEGGAWGIKECSMDPTTKGLVDQGTIKTIIAAPIYVEGKVFGVINVEKMKNPDYTRDDQNLLATCADVAGLVIKNASLHSATVTDLVSTKKLSEEQLKKNEELKGSLTRIVSPKVAEMIMSDPSGLKLGGSKSEVTMFFSDIRGFTRMSESMDPTAIVELLNEYFTRMTDILMELDGTLDKYVGDELMALFGAPVARPDDAMRAVLCGVKMLLALKELQKEWKERGTPVPEIGIGINTGEVTAGYMGSEKQLSYTVIGDNVNLASRLCGVAKGMQMIISRSTYDLVKDYFEIVPLDPINVKGKAKPIEIYQVTGVRSDVDLGAAITNAKAVGAIVTVGKSSAAEASSAAFSRNLTPEQMKQNIKIDDKPKVIECKNCGTENEMQIKFCAKCGMPIF